MEKRLGNTALEDRDIKRVPLEVMCPKMVARPRILTLEYRRQEELFQD
jgi:hypothetical protein